MERKLQEKYDFFEEKLCSNVMSYKILPNKATEIMMNTKINGTVRHIHTHTLAYGESNICFAFMLFVW